MPYLHLPLFLTPLLRTLFWNFWSETYRKFDIVVSPTQTAANVLLKNTPVRTLAVISNGVDRTRFRPKPEERQKLREKYGVQTGEYAIACVGRLDREKHVDILLKAFALLKSPKPVRLLIAGKGSDHKRLIALQNQLQLTENVTFLGFVPDSDLPNLYAAADCYAIASIAELQSISTLEAMAAGLPIVAAHALALPELVQEGVNGYTFEVDNASKAAHCIEKVFASEEFRHSLAAGSLHEAQSHDIHRTIEKFEELYTTLSHKARYQH